jgi:hypothetical protein
MLSIKLSKGYTLKGDEFNAWIERQTESRNKPGEMNNNPTRVTGYYGKLDQLLNGLVDSELARKDIKTLGELADAISEIRELIEEIAVPLEDAFTKKRTKKEN